MQADEEAILDRCQAGDLESFGELVTRYQDRIYRLAYVLVGNRDDALDITQEAFVKAFRSLQFFRRDCAFATWMHRITLNSARNWLRSNRRQVEAPDADWPVRSGAETADLSPEEEVLRRERGRRIRAALDALPPHYREPLILRLYQELTYPEIADVLELPVGTVRSRLSKARDMIFRRLCSEKLAESAREARLK